MEFDFENLKKEVSTDLQIDMGNLSTASIDTAKLYGKYLNMHLDASRALKSAMVNEKKVYKKVWLYYTDKAPAEEYAKRPLNHKILKTDLDKYMDVDSEIIAARERLNELKLIVSYLERVLDQMKSRGFLIKNAIDYEKFKNGGY